MTPTADTTSAPKGTHMSKSRNALSSLRHRLGVAGPARVRGFQGSGASKASRARVVLLVLAAACAAFVLSVAPASAALPTEFGSEGSGAGQLGGEVFGVAVNNDPSTASSGDVYVVDRLNERVNQFTGEGVFVRAFGWDVNKEKPEEKLQECTMVTGCQAGSGGAGAGQLDEPEFVLGGIAVDNATMELPETSVGDVYVLDRNNGRVEKFDGEGHFLSQFAIPGGESIAVGPTGTVYVGENGAAQEYSPEGETLGEPLKLEGLGGVTYLAVNATSEIYATDAPFAESNGQTHPVHRYGVSGEPLGVFDEESDGSARALALDPATGEVYVNQRLASPPEPQQIRGFTAAGVQIAAFDTIPSANRAGLAFGEQTGALYTLSALSGVVRVIVAPERPIVSGESADHLEPTAAVVHAVIGPDAPQSCGETHYHVDYGLTAGYGSSAPLPEGALGASFEEDPVEVPLTGLTTRTEYHYRFVATEECEVEPSVEKTFTTFGSDATFKTQPPALIEEEFTTDVRSTSATLHAKINPLGSATEYRFVYGPTTACGGTECSVPVPDEQLGSGKAGVEVEQHLQGLTAGQTYHYRVITTNTLGEVQGEEHSFTTQTGGEAGLPDSRQWELVSPPDKHGANLLGSEERGVIQAAAGGDGIVYEAIAPTEGGAHGYAEVMQVLARRSGSGWSSRDLEAPHTFPTGVKGAMAYWAFSTDLGLGVLQPWGRFEPALSREATEQTAYLRDSATGVFTPLVIGCTSEGVCPPNRNDTTEPFLPFGEEGTEGNCKEIVCGPAFQGASPDLSHIVLSPDGQSENVVPPLLQGAPAHSLYEWAGGKLALVSELPKENPPEVSGATPSLGGGGGVVTAHAVSNDGSRVFWTAQTQETPELPLLFVRDMTRKETIEIGGANAGFGGANAAGTLVFYSGRECEVLVGAGGLECKPVIGEGGKPVEDGNVLASSEDGSWVYFRQGASIYVRHGSEAARLVASGIGNIGPSEGPLQSPWRASPNGEWFSFMSDSSLTGYDNHDALSGRPDEEVYLYSAAAGRLVCASCDPTGARPQGSTALNLAKYAVKQWYQTPLAATIPGWVAYQNRFTVYDPRFLSDSGRLFFNAVGALVPRDVNGQVDTYELEPPGVGGCTTSTQTGTVVYVPAAAGCVALISSGESGEESVFEDASETGEDVFFLSSSRLSTADLDGSVSMWDAHACTGASPCIPSPASPAPPCNTESSCKASPSPQPQIYGAPASATFNGPGNVAPPVTKKAAKKTVKCRRGFVKNKKGRCVKKPKQRSKKAKKTSNKRRTKS
jgi:hypothetical protein